MVQRTQLSYKDDEALAKALRGLATRPRRNLAEHIFDEFVVAPGPASDVFVAFNRLGVRYVTCLQDPREKDSLIEDYERRFSRPLLAAAKPPAGLAESLRTGRRRTLRVDLSSLTAFERDVLEATSQIPRGEVRSYGWVATAIGRPKAVRATGSALAHNPVPFIIPCHRVIRSDGTVGNYGFGSTMKEDLLRSEGVDLASLYRYV